MLAIPMYAVHPATTITFKCADGASGNARTNRRSFRSPFVVTYSGKVGLYPSFGRHCWLEALTIFGLPASLRGGSLAVCA